MIAGGTMYRVRWWWGAHILREFSTKWLPLARFHAWYWKQLSDDVSDSIVLEVLDAYGEVLRRER